MSDTTEVPALPGDALRDVLVDQLRTALGDGLLEVELEPASTSGCGCAPMWRAAGQALRDIVGCQYFCFLSAIDWMPSPRLHGRGEDNPRSPRPSAARRSATASRARPASSSRCSHG